MKPQLERRAGPAGIGCGLVHGCISLKPSALLNRSHSATGEKLASARLICKVGLCKNLAVIDLPVVADPEDVLSQPTRARLFALLAELKRPAGTAELAERLELHPKRDQTSSGAARAGGSDRASARQAGTRPAAGRVGDRPLTPSRAGGRAPAPTKTSAAGWREHSEHDPADCVALRPAGARSGASLHQPMRTAGPRRLRRVSPRLDSARVDLRAPTSTAYSRPIADG
jgi:hypothetical protein